MHMSKCFAQITICPQGLQKRNDAKNNFQFKLFPTFELRSYIIIVIMWLRTLTLVVVFYVLYNCVSHNIFRRLSLLIVHLQYCLVSLISLLLYKQVQISYFISV